MYQLGLLSSRLSNKVCISNRLNFHEVTSGFYIDLFQYKLCSWKYHLTLKGWRGINLTPLPSVFFSKMYLLKKGRRPGFLWFFNIIISHIFTVKGIEILQTVQKIWRFSPSTLTIFINFLDFLTFPCYKETNDATCNKYQHFFYFQPILSRLFNSCIKLYWY